MTDNLIIIIITLLETSFSLLFAGILILITDENENCFKTTVLIGNQCTWTVRNQVSTFLSLVNKDLPVKKMYLQQIFIIFEREPILNV